MNRQQNLDSNDLEPGSLSIVTFFSRLSLFEAK